VSENRDAQRTGSRERNSYDRNHRRDLRYPAKGHAGCQNPGLIALANTVGDGAIDLPFLRRFLVTLVSMICSQLLKPRRRHIAVVLKGIRLKFL
jgi:hypothetical protein